jgi:hypothetical protein
MGCVDGDKSVVNGCISRLQVVYDVKKVSDCLILRKWALKIPVVAQQSRNQVPRFQVRMSHENIDKISGNVCDESAAVTVEYLGFRLLL